MEDISVFLPIYNEAENISTVVENTVSFLENNTNDYELILINDGSTDNTLEILNNISQKNAHLKVIDHVNNKGYGAAISTGINNSKNSWIFFMDSDGQFDINNLQDFFPHTQSSDLVIGYRRKRNDPAFRIFLAKIYKRIVGLIFNLKVKDIDCAFKLMKRDKITALNINSTSFFICTEILCKSKKHDYKITELPVEHFSRSKGSSSVTIKRSFASLVELLKLYISINE